MTNQNNAGIPTKQVAPATGNDVLDQARKDAAKLIADKKAAGGAPSMTGEKSKVFNGTVLQVGTTILTKSNTKKYILCAVQTNINGVDLKVTAQRTLTRLDDAGNDLDDAPFPEVGQNCQVYLSINEDERGKRPFFELSLGMDVNTPDEILAALSLGE